VAHPVFVISGPSGVGKGTLLAELMKQMSALRLAISATTRARRPQEIDGRDYYFMDEAQFKSHQDNNDFLEWACVHGKYYGTLRSEVTRKAILGPVLIEIDVQGAESIRQSGLAHTSVFIMPPSLEELAQRLRGRHTEAEAEIAKRLKQAENEMKTADRYNYVLTNRDLSATVAELKAIVLNQLKRSSS
jgi:guanylate kinase